MKNCVIDVCANGRVIKRVRAGTKADMFAKLASYAAKEKRKSTK